MTRQYQSAPVTSASPERFFSRVGLVQTDLRDAHTHTHTHYLSPLPTSVTQTQHAKNVDMFVNRERCHHCKPLPNQYSGHRYAQDGESESKAPPPHYKSSTTSSKCPSTLQVIAADLTYRYCKCTPQVLQRTISAIGSRFLRCNQESHICRITY